MNIKFNKSNKGTSLVEMLITIAITLIVMACVLSAFTFFSKTFVAISNYTEMNQKNCNVIDRMSQRIRQTQSLIAFNTNQVSFKDYDGTTLTYTYNPYTRLFLQQDSQGTKTLMENCDFLNFAIFQRNASNNFTFYPATTNTAKIVSVTWRTSKNVINATNTESVQTAKVVIRN